MCRCLRRKGKFQEEIGISRSEIWDIPSQSLENNLYNDFKWLEHLLGGMNLENKIGSFWRLGRFRPFWFTLAHFGLFRTFLRSFGPFWNVFGCFQGIDAQRITFLSAWQPFQESWGCRERWQKDAKYFVSTDLVLINICFCSPLAPGKKLWVFKLFHFRKNLSNFIRFSQTLKSASPLLLWTDFTD